MSDQDKPRRPRIPEVIKMPQTDEEKDRHIREVMINDLVDHSDFSRKEAARRIDGLAAALENDPIVREIFASVSDDLAKLPEAERLAIFFKMVRTTIEKKEAEAHPKPTLRIWTDSEDDRRSKPKGDGIPDL